MAGGGLALMICVVFYLPGLSPAEKNLRPDDPYAPLTPSENAFFMQEQLGVRRISQVARGLGGDYDHLLQRYTELPRFTPPADGRLTEEGVVKYITAYETVVRERNHFFKQVMGERPGVFQVVAMVGMIHQFYEVQRVRGLLAGGIRQEEFDWLLGRIMEAALFCVQYKLDNEPLTEEEQKRLLDLRENLYLATGVKHTDDGVTKVFHPEKLRLEQVPQVNIALFLKYYRRINYPTIHFTKPTMIYFDEMGIIEAARHNPP